MNKFLLTVVACFMAAATFAQAPASFNFQAVARDASGAIIPTKAISFRISILQNSSTGTMVYQETHTANTNQYGLVNLSIGSGNVASGTFSTINWGADKYFLKIDMDPNGGSSYTDMGTQQLVSVPYALNAETAKTVTNSDNDTTNEIQMISKTGASITLSKTGGNITLLDDDATNEIQTLSISGTNVTLSQSGGTVSIADNDNNSSNEIQSITKSGLNVTLSNGGGSVSVADNDNSTSNELQQISVVGTNLSLNKTGGTVPINNLNHWNKTGANLNYNVANAQVGIGIATPANVLHVQSSKSDTALVHFRNTSTSIARGTTTLKAEGANNSYGYLGVTSRDGMDGNALIKFPGGTSGREVGVLGVSTGNSSTDNVGVMGLTNGGWPGYFKNTGNGNQVSIGTTTYGLSIDTGH